MTDFISWNAPTQKQVESNLLEMTVRAAQHAAVALPGEIGAADIE
jgi:hypothetical protein